MSNLNKAVQADVGREIDEIGNKGTGKKYNKPHPIMVANMSHFMNPEYIAKHGLEASVKAFKDTVASPSVKMNYFAPDGASEKVAVSDGKGGAGSNMFILKPFHDGLFEYGGRLSNGFSELTSQAIYHAGGIGHLFHKVFPVTIKRGGETDESPHKDDGQFIVIHGHPSHDILDEYEAMDGYEDGSLDPLRHMHSFLKLQAMDFLLHNGDRHLGNVIFRKNGQPIAIDNAIAFKGAQSFTLHKGWMQAMNKIARSAGHTMGFTDIGPFKDFMKANPGNVQKFRDWWTAARPKMESALESNLAALHPDGAHFVRRSFQERADHISHLFDPSFTTPPFNPSDALSVKHIDDVTMLNGIDLDEGDSYKGPSMAEIPLTHPSIIIPRYT